MAVCVSTEDRLEYQFHRLRSARVQFRIKAAHDAHIALTMDPREGDPMWEVFIGGWKNSKSVIRKNRTRPDVAEVDTPEILSGDEFRGFWISWDGAGQVSVGTEGTAEPLMSWQDPQPFPVNYIGVCTGWGATGEWMIEAICIDESGGERPIHQHPSPSAPNFVAQPHSYSSDGSGMAWLDARNGEVPPGAVQGGEDGDEPLFVARAEHEGELIPGKLKPSHGVCYVAHGGQEHGKSDYQVLCASNVSWMPTNGDNLPPNALPAGHSDSGEPLFAGRVNHEGTLTLGKVHPSHRSLYIPFAGQEIAFQDFEVLVML